MANITATVVYGSSITAHVADNPHPHVPAVGIQGIAGVSVPLEDMQNVDATNLQDGSLLVYNTTTSKWTATTQLNAQDMDAGEF